MPPQVLGRAEAARARGRAGSQRDDRGRPRAWRPHDDGGQPAGARVVVLCTVEDGDGCFHLLNIIIIGMDLAHDEIIMGGSLQVSGP